MDIYAQQPPWLEGQVSTAFAKAAII